MFRFQQVPVSCKLISKPSFQEKNFLTEDMPSAGVPILQQTSPGFKNCFQAFRTGGLLTGIFHLVALGFVHYLQIVRPFDHTKVVSIRTVRRSFGIRSQVHVLIVLIWTVPPIFLFLYFAVWEGQGYQSPNCRIVDFYDKLVFRVQISLIIILLMCATCFAYWMMLSKISSVTSSPLSNLLFRSATGLLATAARARPARRGAEGR